MEIAGDVDTVAWFCLRSKPKSEHIAEQHLLLIDGVEVFNPRIRFQRLVSGRRVWVTESLFPNYLFARFDWRRHLNAVRYAHGVAKIINFGEKYPIVPDEVIRQLREAVGDEGVRVIPPEVKPGDEVRIVDGPFQGLEVLVTRVLPGGKRVQVLLEFLGQQRAVEISADRIVRRKPRP